MAFKVGLRWGRLAVCSNKVILYRGFESLPFVPKAGATMCDEACYSTSQSRQVVSYNCFLKKQKVDEARGTFLSLRVIAMGSTSNNSLGGRKNKKFLFAPSALFRIAAVLPGHIVEGVEGTVTRVELREIM